MKSSAPIARAGRDDLVACVAAGSAELDVVGDRTGEEEVLLRDHRDRAPQVVLA